MVNELWLSPVTTWEVMTHASAGRVVLTPDAADWIRQALAAAPAFEAPLSHDIALAVHETGLPHKDPAHRLLVATAQHLNLTLVTSDDPIVKYANARILAN
jgi:PIN domain nuclease of toxin-antitoxin system